MEISMIRSDQRYDRELLQIKKIVRCVEMMCGTRVIELEIMLESSVGARYAKSMVESLNGNDVYGQENKTLNQLKFDIVEILVEPISSSSREEQVVIWEADLSSIERHRAEAEGRVECRREQRVLALADLK